MKNEVIEKIFRDRSSMYTALSLRAVFEENIRLRCSVTNFAASFLDQWLEENETLLIQGMIRAFNPEAFQNVQKMDARKIWRKYWDIRKLSPATPFSAFKFLATINKNPY